MRFVFAGTPNCEVVHGVLYSCLRALFGLSVIGILVCIFSCMLVYQLLRYVTYYIMSTLYSKIRKNPIMGSRTVGLKG